MEVRELNSAETNRWDAYVRNANYSTPYHLCAWKDVLTEVFNNETHYLLAEEDNRIVGVLPLLHIKSVLTGDYFTSLPGGLCADSEAAAEALVTSGKNLVKEERANYMILRDGRRRWDLPGLVTDEDHVTFVLDLDADLELIKSDFKKRTRQLVNKAVNSDLESVIGMKNLPEYYPVYAQAMKELGTPTQGIDFFKCMADYLPDESNLLTLYYEKQIVGGGFMAPFKDTVYCTWAGMLRKYYYLRSAHLLVWRTVAYGHENGFHCVDLGRCRKDSGSYDFKKDFGAKPVQLYQQTYLNGSGAPPPVGNNMEENLRYRVFVKVWKLLPTQVTEIVGPRLRKQVPFG